MDSLTPYYRLLKSHHLFAGFDDNELQQLLTTCHLKTLGRGDWLFHQGDPAPAFYFVIEGAIKLFRTTRDGNEKILEVSNSHETFAEAIMFAGQSNYPVNAQALKNSTVLAIPCPQYIECITRHPQYALALAARLSQRLHSLVNEIETLSLKNATHRVVRFLINGITDNLNREPVIELEIPKRLVASRLSIQPETFSRILHHLTDEKIISSNGKLITILDLERLLHYE
ncbi:Crp/Fnr family transcriptional regulator [Aestuariirhabdus sp. Z084]|uniref:Crp/Fnr family transcriptional regulator n=1 Tax=Aestuariirhabdus haliotis TaxID=2918751 RepID=UPI00201B394D|nr:Crp/Fnr family transcriptional regulator [Aestuariirhabdus haliotis]MCL6415389.1 Crp/Fnr family transcriptional regulator [Aestuariirhabdus haliotis]MCL6419145.1 Crp/Fnr family transcriptional regulator [Aestuariirhabdus haliotis]